jgi:GNAT superfamily N-acetyltransferase
MKLRPRNGSDDGMMIIRRAVKSDIWKIQAVGTSAWRDTYSDLLPESYIEAALARWWCEEYLTPVIESEEHILLVAVEAGHVIGVAETQILDEQRAILWKLYVLKHHRGKGVGTSLIEESVQRLPSRIEVYYTEYYDFNHQAAAFYGARGFLFDRAEELDVRGTPIVSIYVKRFL